ncbi:rCG37493 [Rattus norvegicus]|uniref:RCG37493 n=1 Tax=Rattus norvegicus TaxID=10116 RepID=A6KHV0_RAT|nr:rCG37493 [Rattus norvegicus]
MLGRMRQEKDLNPEGANSLDNTGRSHLRRTDEITLVELQHRK